MRTLGMDRETAEMIVRQVNEDIADKPVGGRPSAARYLVAIAIATFGWALISAVGYFINKLW